MKKYIGFEMVEAKPMSAFEYSEQSGMSVVGGEGYEITSPDGYISWQPKEEFEKTHMEVGDNNTIMETNVHDFVKDIKFSKWGKKTTIANATLANGFIITESSSCVDPANFNMDIGSGICRDAIYNRVWNHLGFLLQCAKYGIK